MINKLCDQMSFVYSESQKSFVLFTGFRTKKEIKKIFKNLLLLEKL